MGWIYKIINVATDDFYVGSAVKEKRRKWEHWTSLKQGVHHCVRLQAAWNEYGEDAFEFVLVEQVDDDKLLQVEDTYLALNAGQEHCYNTALSTQIPSSLQSSVREKISRSLKQIYNNNPTKHPRLGRTHSAETRAKLSAAKLANPSRHWLGKVRSEETKRKIGDAQRGKPKAPGRKISEEGMAKIRAAAAAGHYATFKGKKHTEEAKQKLRKRVFVMPDNREFPSVSATLEHYKLKMPTLRRALKSGKPISKGRYIGYTFKYVDTPPSQGV